MAVGLSPMKPLHAASMRLDFFVAGGNPYAAREHCTKVSYHRAERSIKKLLETFFPFAEKSEKIAP